MQQLAGTGGSRMDFKVTTNDRGGWQAVWGQLQQQFPFQSDEKYTFSVTLNTENDVTSLRYYFPLWSFLMRNHVTAQLNLSGTEDMLQRAKQFLSILVNDSEEISLVRFGDLENNQRGLICKAYLAQDTSLTPEEKDIVSCVLADMTVRQPTPGEYIYTLAYPRYYRQHNGSWPIKDELLRQTIYDIPETAPKRNKDRIRFKYLPYRDPVASDLLPLIPLRQNSSQSDLWLQQLIQLYRTYSDKQFEEKQLSLQADEIPSFINTPLAELIFYYMLRNLHDSGRIICSSGEQSEIDMILLKKTALDAKSYAEGLLQIIENAQVHSCGGIAYFGMRIYRADSDSTMYTLAKETNTRHILWQNYWLPRTATTNTGSPFNTSDRNNIFNLKNSSGARTYPDFIEFYVLDDAIDGNRVPQGILEKIRSDQQSLDKNRDLHTISEIFKLDERDYANNPIDFYVKHYGMRWLRMHADRLNAIVQIYSPHQTEFFSWQGQDYIRAADLGGLCFSNIFSDGSLLSRGKKPSNGSLARAKGGAIGMLQKVDGGNYTMDGQPKDRIFVKEELELLLPYPKCYSTEYSILVPLAYGPVPHKTTAGKVTPLSFDVGHAFYRDTAIQSVRLEFDPLPAETLQSDSGKSTLVDALTRKLSENINLGQLLRKAESSVCEPGTDAGKAQLNFISLHGHTPAHIELLAKAFFSIIYQTVQQLSDRARLSLLFAVDFGKQRDLINEFVRIFSIFYTKQGKNAYMDSVQIALCSDAAGGKKEINFILAGDTLRSAYNTANSFVYHNADGSLEFVPLLDYLTPPESAKSHSPTVPLCPFDLLLTGRQDMCWFLEQMKEKLDTDQRTNRYGCKLSNIHVRLGSKIHIDKFYGAELLFHNVGNINRFAYLIASHIDRDLPKNPEVVFLVGYENYSAVLLQTVVQLLEQRHPQTKLYWITDTRSSGKYPSISFDKFPQEECLLWHGQKILCYTIIPIGSTMSTVHKLLASFRRGMIAAVRGGKASAETNENDPDITPKNHYAIVAVGDCFKPGTQLNEPADRYLSNFSSPASHEGSASTDHWYSCTLQSHASKEDPLRVHYCLWAETKWHLATPLDLRNSSEPSGDPCAVEQPLIQVDKTSTLLNAIFQTPLPTEVLDYYYHTSQKQGRNQDAKAMERIALLRPHGHMHYIRYGHISQGDNHYQFYFDFQNMASSPKILKQLTEWAKNISIDADAYNIVISPLQITNAIFLKTIIDHVFGSNLHLLHIDINGTGKETVRTKFEYISEELKRISNAYSAIHFYYVDDSICTGATIQRAYKFLLMLCQQAGLDPSALLRGYGSFHFEKVFLFVNRNSYETARIWVRRPAEDWKGFINLCVPSYNTHANTCPACRIRDRFQLLSKRSATNQLTAYFSRSASKHSARTLAEYDRYLSGEILDNPAYLSWLRTYVNGHATSPDASVIEKDQYRQAKALLLNASADHASRTLSQLSQAHPEIPFVPLMRYVVAQEHFSRLDTMNLAYIKLVYSRGLQKIYRNCAEGSHVDPKNLDFAPYQRELMVALLTLFSGALTPKGNDYDQIMTFSSYIKVVSRDYIVRNYFIREAIYSALHCILILLIESPPHNCDETQFQQYFQSATPINHAEAVFFNTICDQSYASFFHDIWQRFGQLDRSQGLNVDLLYRVFKITAHRLALLHSHFIIEHEVVDKVLTAYSKLLDHCPIEDKWRLPSVDELVKTYLASIKTATMSEDDDSMCHNLLKLGGDNHVS